MTGSTRTSSQVTKITGAIKIAGTLLVKPAKIGSISNSVKPPNGKTHSIGESIKSLARNIPISGQIIMHPKDIESVDANVGSGTAGLCEAEGVSYGFSSDAMFGF